MWAKKKLRRGLEGNPEPPQCTNVSYHLQAEEPILQATQNCSVVVESKGCGKSNKKKSPGARITDGFQRTETAGRNNHPRATATQGTGALPKLPLCATVALRYKATTNGS